VRVALKPSCLVLWDHGEIYFAWIAFTPSQESKGRQQIHRELRLHFQERLWASAINSFDFMWIEFTWNGEREREVSPKCLRLYFSQSLFLCLWEQTLNPLIASPRFIL
jgi:hypothetical protein